MQYYKDFTNYNPMYLLNTQEYVSLLNTINMVIDPGACGRARSSAVDTMVDSWYHDSCQSAPTKQDQDKPVLFWHSKRERQKWALPDPPFEVYMLPEPLCTFMPPWQPFRYFPQGPATVFALICSLGNDSAYFGCAWPCEFNVGLVGGSSISWV